MKDERKAKKRFIITETVLLFAAAFFEFALIGYKTTALVLAGIALLAALYRLIDVLRRKNEKTARVLKKRENRKGTQKDTKRLRGAGRACTGGYRDTYNNLRENR